MFEIGLAQGKRTDLIEKYKVYIKNLCSEMSTGQEETNSEKNRLLSFWVYLLVSIILIHG